MIRSVARIDIGLNLDSDDEAGGLDNFTLTYAGYIYGAKQSYLIPERENINGDHVIAPSYHSTYQYTMHTTLQTATPGTAINDDRAIGGMFPWDTRGDFSSDTSYFCLIISGSYTDTEGKTSTQHYRIVLVDPADPDKRLDILRNHKYRVNILSVDGPGYSSQAEAQSGISSNNIVYELSVHEEGNINHVVYSGTQYLGVSNVHSEHDGTAGTGEIKIKTNVTGGWRMATVVDDNTGKTPTWITFTDTSGGANTVGTASFTLTQNLSDPRSAVVTFTTGALSIPVRILQNGTWYIYSDYQPGMMMRGDGDEYGIYLHGMVPNKVWVRAYSPEFEDYVNRQGSQGSNSPDKYAVSRFTLEFTGTGTGIPETGRLTDNLEIIANAMVTNQIRQVQFQYTTDLKTDGTTEWTPFDEGPQSKGHYTLYTTGRTVALYNLKDATGEDMRLDWAEAMGINTSFNDAYFYTTWNSTIPPFRVLPLDGFTYPYLRDRDNYYYTPTAETGCAAYYEEGDERFAKGKWRLPARIEIVEMIPFLDHIGDLPVNSKYWSGLEDIADQAFANNLVTGTGDITRKIEKYLVRCVLKEE